MGGVAHVVMCRPEKRNSMTADFWRELPECISELDDAEGVRAVVISAEGPHFSSGMDISLFEHMFAENTDPSLGHQRPMMFLERVRSLQRVFNALERCRMPVICAMHGGVIGGAVDMVAACDMRYATRDAFVCIEETNLALTADLGTFPRLMRLIPEGVCRELAYTGRRMSAEEAKARGLVNDVFDDHESMMNHVWEIARTIAAKSPSAVYGCKHVMNYARDHSTADTLDYVGVWNASMLKLDEVEEALTARSEKRQAQYPDLPPRRR